mmetsp:Transcript_40536/g.99588  ORF Transcript_40536/g.99588 Transcript_40536/m.99588 type:complete len:240 (+) Transcript_40536:795-1514(+)
MSPQYNERRCAKRRTLPACSASAVHTSSKQLRGRSISSSVRSRGMSAPTCASVAASGATRGATSVSERTCAVTQRGTRAAENATSSASAVTSAATARASAAEMAAVAVGTAPCTAHSPARPSVSSAPLASAATASSMAAAVAAYVERYVCAMSVPRFGACMPCAMSTTTLDVRHSHGDVATAANACDTRRAAPRVGVSTWRRMRTSSSVGSASKCVATSGVGAPPPSSTLSMARSTAYE